MNVAEYYNAGHSLAECAKKYGLTQRTAMDKIRELEAEIDMPVTDSLYDSYIRKIKFVRALFGYTYDNLEELKKKDYESYFTLSWISATRRLTGKRI